MQLLKLAAVVIIICSFAGTTMTQEEGSSGANRTMRPVVRGRHFAVASMKAEATRAAERILEKGGNAFDAIVAGQAVLGIVDQAMNGVGSDATILVYDAKTKKVYSVNAEAPAPRQRCRRALTPRAVGRRRRQQRCRPVDAVPRPGIVIRHVHLSRLRHRADARRPHGQRTGRRGRCPSRGHCRAGS